MTMSVKYVEQNSLRLRDAFKDWADGACAATTVRRPCPLVSLGKGGARPDDRCCHVEHNFCHWIKLNHVKILCVFRFQGSSARLLTDQRKHAQQELVGFHPNWMHCCGP